MGKKGKAAIIVSMLGLLLSIGLLVFIRQTNKDTVIVTQDPIIIENQIAMEEKLEDLIVTENSLTKEEKLEDLEYMLKFIEENYPLLKTNKETNGFDWLGEKDNFRKLIENTTTDEMFMSEITKIIEKLNDIQSFVFPMDSFKDYYAFFVDPNNKEEYKHWFDVINNEKILKWYKFDESQLESSDSKPIYSRNRLSYCLTDILVANEVAYLKIYSCNPDKIEEDGKKIREFLNGIKDYEKLIIDIRAMEYWFGDTDDYWMKNIVEPLAKNTMSVDDYVLLKGSYGKTFHEQVGIKFYPISELPDNNLAEEVRANFDYYHIQNTTIHPVEPIEFNGKIYLLVDNKSGLSAENFAAFCKNNGFATLVGEPTSGLNYSLPNIIFSLPNSGIVTSMRSLVYLNSDGTIGEKPNIVPDIEVDATRGTSFEKDNAIQYVINN